MKRTLTIDTPQNINQQVLLKGWVHFYRDKGKIIFFELRDVSDIAQCVVLSENEQAFKTAKGLNFEDVIELTGKVNKRPEKQINQESATGTVEIMVEQIKVLNKSTTLPFEISKDKFKDEVREELRLKYRYLDLRRPKMKEKIILRHKIVKFIRDFLDQKGFFEIETPILTKGTPEGAREYIVPSRLYPGKFYVLPQSPQQFKQLLMVAGFERYYQIARCFRDEDTRGDRQPEFTQLDIEMSFITEEEILTLVEKLFIELIKNVTPEKKITKIPFPRLVYKEAMEKYHSDKPDLRKDPKSNPQELAFCWITEMPLFEFSAEEKKLVSGHHPFTSPHDEDLNILEKEPFKVRGKAYDLVLNGYEIGSGSMRIHSPALQNKIFKILGLGVQEVERRFGHLLRAFEYGAPPHGGIAPGIDRIVMILANETNIREVIAFPKTTDVKDLMMGAPSELPEKQLEEVHIKIKNPKSKTQNKKHK